MSEALLRLSCFGQVVETVQRCIDAGRIAHDDAFLVACGLWASLHGVTSLMIVKPDFPWPEADLADHMIGTALRGLQVPSSKATSPAWRA